MAFATASELASYLQQDVDTATATLVLDLVEIDLAAAAHVDAVDLPAGAKSIGLAVAARVYSNPTGLTSDALDDYRRNFGGSYLTVDEIERLAAASGRSGAFSITPYAEPDTTTTSLWGSSL